MSHIIPSEEIAFRHDFSILANARGYLDAVEVGTDLGVFAREFLSRFKGNWLLCVDPYAPHAEFKYDRTGDLLTAVQALAPFHGHFRFVRGRSPQVAPWVASVISPQFVYIDASHEETDVAADLDAWWRVLSDDGLLAGHDFDDCHPGVIAAVTRFADDRCLTVRLTHEKAPSPPSWYIYKCANGEPAQLFHRFFRDAESQNERFEACQPFER